MNSQSALAVPFHDPGVSLTKVILGNLIPLRLPFLSPCSRLPVLPVYAELPGNELNWQTRLQAQMSRDLLAFLFFSDYKLLPILQTIIKDVFIRRAVIFTFFQKN